MATTLASLLALLLVAPSAAGASPTPAMAATAAERAVVVAVIDTELSPYHWDFLASAMPQARKGTPLPLDRPPHEWLPGFSTDGLASYAELPVTLGTGPDDLVADLYQADRPRWDSFPESDIDAVHYRWIPGTKVIGALAFQTSSFVGGNGSHGTQAASVAVGNLHGTCPECLLVHISAGTDLAGFVRALEWAAQQEWIDVITNSVIISTTFRDGMVLGRGPTFERSREASDRGQTIFFAAGNGRDGSAVVPNPTYYSSNVGPDWIMTVGAVTPSGGGYTGTAKPVDLAAPGNRYPSSGGRTVTGTGLFGGTSNASPVTAGLYASGLGWAREALGSGRVQADGVIARGAPVPCGQANPDCELGDGELTAEQLRTRLLHGAVRTPQGPNVGPVDAPLPVTTDEYELMSTGHGAYFGRIHGDEQWQAEAERITGPMTGAAAPLARPDGEREWMVVDSFCRQWWWGTWDGGYWNAGDPLPGPQPLWPLRTALEASCSAL